MAFPDDLQMPPGSLYTARYPMAMAYAATQHAAQVRKDDARSPYIGHPMAVSGFVLDYGWGRPEYSDEIEDLAIAALLHDVAEDQGGEPVLEDIEQLFGPRVSQIVRAASDSLVADAGQKAPWRERKESHIALARSLAQDASAGDPGACLVMACDKLHNLIGTAAGVARDGEGYLDRFRSGSDGARWYYRSMFEALRPSLPDRLAADLESQLQILGA
jgi:(p)ppGpp synthase/HD superfamily hydrolase